MTVMTAKAVAFITRPARSQVGSELLVFSHPSAGVQLPSGSLFDDEDPALGAAREAWEEAGLRVGDTLESCGEIASWVEPDTDLIRYAFHYRCRDETPDEWWVVTPDGNGLCWRYWWTPLDGREPIHPRQRPWLDRVRDKVREDPRRKLRERARLHAPFNSPSAVHAFVAPPAIGKWVVGLWVPGDQTAKDGVACVHAVCVTGDGQAVLIAETAVDQQGDEYLAWAPPGGTIEPGETIADALAREVAEEACATALKAETLGFAHIAVLDDHGEIELVEWRASARVGESAPDPWDPRFETVERRLVPSLTSSANFPVVGIPSTRAGSSPPSPTNIRSGRDVGCPPTVVTERHHPSPGPPLSEAAQFALSCLVRVHTFRRPTRDRSTRFSSRRRRPL